MAIKILGDDLTELEVDDSPLEAGSGAARAVIYDPSGQPAVFQGRPRIGGYFSCVGNTATIAASLAADNYRWFARMSPSSRHVARLQRMEVHVVAATVDATAAVAGSLGMFRFVDGTPVPDASAGVYRYTPSYAPSASAFSTFNRMDEQNPFLSDLTIAENTTNANMGVTGVALGAQVSATKRALMGSNGPYEFRWVVEPPRRQPVLLYAGDGLLIKTTVAMNATATWHYAWTMHWQEEQLDRSEREI